MSGFAIIYLSCVGLGLAIMPVAAARRWSGPCFLAGFAAILIGLFLGNVVAGIPLHLVAWLIAAAALLAIAVRVPPLVRAGSHIDLLFHPVIVLPVPVFLLALATSGFAYLPYTGDESNWIGWAQQMVVKDHFVARDMLMVSISSYTPGWPLAMAYPGAIMGTFRVADAAPIPFLIHVGLLGVVYDVVRWRLKDMFGDNAAASRLVGWGIILFLLLIGAGWKLVPTILLIEKPQIYPLAALVLLAWPLQDRTAGRQVALAWGLVLAALYLIKVATLIFIPAALLLALGGAYWARREDGNGAALRLLSATLLPIALVMILWQAFRLESGDSCFGRPGTMLNADNIKLLISPQSVEMISRLGDALWAYTASFKPWLTVLGLTGIVAAFASRRTAVIGLALTGYAIVYVFGMYWTYLACFGGYEQDILASHQRYYRVMLRVIHIAGPVLLLLWAVGLAPLRSLLERMTTGRWVPATLAALMVLAGWQGVQAERSLRDMATRALQPGQKRIAYLARLGREFDLLLMLTDRLAIKTPLVMILEQGEKDRVARPVNLMRLGRVRGGPLGRVKLVRTTSFGEQPVNIWMQKSTPAKLRRLVLSADVLWPIKTDPWARAALAPLIDDASCRGNPERYFLIPQSRRSLRCVPKTGP